MKLESMKENINSLLDNIAEGWRHLRTVAASALTRFSPGEKTNLPAAGDIDDRQFQLGRHWSMLGGDMFEDDRRLVVRLEAPGLSKEDINIDVVDDALVISGEKRFEHETSQGRWRVMQCAYGRFRRVFPLPLAVNVDESRASYKDGVLRVELLKAKPGQPKGVSIKVD